MKCNVLQRACPVFLLTAAGLVTDLHADVLYSNLQGNYLSQQVASYTYTKPNTDYYGTDGFGTYYNTGYDQITLTGFSFFGGSGEFANSSNGSLGDAISVSFITLMVITPTSPMASVPPHPTPARAAILDKESACTTIPIFLSRFQGQATSFFRLTEVSMLTDKLGGRRPWHRGLRRSLPSMAVHRP